VVIRIFLLLFACLFTYLLINSSSPFFVEEELHASKSHQISGKPLNHLKSGKEQQQQAVLVPKEDVLLPPLNPLAMLILLPALQLLLLLQKKRMQRRHVKLQLYKEII
jgi:hypothetical protein